MSDKFEGAVAALSNIVELAAKPIIRKVRTPEGAAKYGQAIGSVIVTDPSGKVLDTLHKGSGSLSDSPPTSSFANDPKAAKHGAVLPGQGAFANKAQQATYSSGPSAASVGAGPKKQVAKVVSSASEGHVAGGQKAQHLSDLKSKLTHTNTTVESDDEIFSTAEVKVGNGTVAVLVSSHAKVAVKGNVAYVRHPNGGLPVVVGYRATGNFATPYSQQKISYYKKFPEGAEPVDLQMGESGSGSPSPKSQDKAAAAKIAYSVSYKKDGDGEPLPEGHAAVVATDSNGEVVGTLLWDFLADPPKVVGVTVAPENQNQGIATAMWNVAKKNESKLQHDDVLTDEGKNWVSSLDKPDSAPSQKAQSDALQEAQDKADAAANNTKASADEIDRAKNSVLKQQKTESSFYGGVSGGAADSTRALVGAFLEAAKSGKDVYAQSGAQGWFWSDDKPMNGYVVSPTGEIHGFKAGVGKEAPVKFNSALSSWTALLDKYTKKSAGPEAAAQAKSKTDSYIATNLAGAGVQGDVVKQTIDTPKGPMEIHVTPDAEIFTTGTGAIVRHKSGAFPDGYNVKYNAKGGPLLNAKMVASAKKYEAPEAKAPEAPEPEVSEVDDSGDVDTKLWDAAVSDVHTEGGLSVEDAEFAEEIANNVYVASDFSRDGWAETQFGNSNAASKITKNQVPRPGNAAWNEILDYAQKNHALTPKGAAVMAATLHIATSSAYTDKDGFLYSKGGASKAAVDAVMSDVNAVEEGAWQWLMEAGKDYWDPDAPVAKFGPADYDEPLAGFGEDADTPQPTDAKFEVPEGTWLLTSGGIQRAVPVGKKDTVWQGTDGLFVVEKADGSAKQYSWNKDFWGSAVPAAVLAIQKEAGTLSKVEQGEQPFKPSAPEKKTATDTLNIAAIAKNLGIAAEDFSIANVHVPNHGTVKIHVTEGATAHGVGTGVVVTYPTSDGDKKVKYQSVSGKVVVETKPLSKNAIPLPMAVLGEAAEVPEKVDLPDQKEQSDALQEAQDKADAAAASLKAVAPAAETAVQALKKAAQALATPVKGSKYGDDSNGAKGWLFSTHVSAAGSPVYTDSDQWGNTYLYEVGVSAPLAGPFGKVSDAKHWLSSNGNPAESAPETSASLPEKHDVPSSAGKKIKSGSEAPKPVVKKAAAPKASEASAPAAEEIFYWLSTDGGSAKVPHPKYGVISVEVGADSKIYNTGVGVVVKNSDGSGSVTSGKTGKVEKFDSLPDNKLPKSSTVEVKQKQAQTPNEAAESALQSALDSKNQKDIDAALDAEQTPAAEAPSDLPEEALADWEKELLGIPLDDAVDPVPDPEPAPVPHKFGFADELGNALAEGFLPDWMKSEVDGAEGVWSVNSASGKSLLVHKDGKYHAYYPYATKGTLQNSHSEMSSGGALYMIGNDEDYGAQKISVEFDAPAAKPDADTPAPTPSADAPSINPENVASPVKGDWIKGKKIDNGYLLLGVTDDDGAPVEVIKKDGPFNGYGYSTVWDTPWGDANTLKKAKALAAKHGNIDPAVVKAPAAPKKKSSKAGSTNALGTPEVEWKGHRFLVVPGMRMFEYNDELYVFNGSDGAVVSSTGARTSSVFTQKNLKDMGATQIAYGGSAGLGKYDFSQHLDPDTPAQDYYSDNFSTMGALFSTGSLAKIANFAQYVETDAYTSSSWRKKMLHGAEISAKVLQVRKKYDETGEFDGEMWASILAARSTVSLPSVVAKEINDLIPEYALKFALASGYNVGDDIAAMDVEQVRAFAASRGFPLAAYIKTPAEARSWLLFEVLPAYQEVSPHQKLFGELLHQKTLAKVAVGDKYDKYLSQSVAASAEEIVVPAPGEGTKEAVLKFLSDAGTSLSTQDYGSVDLSEQIYKSGNLVLAAAASTSPDLAFEALPAATKQAFYARVAVHGANSVVSADAAGYYIPSGVEDAYQKFAESAPAALPFTPHLASLQKKLSAENLKDLKTSVSKPAGVPASTWAIVVGAVEGGTDEFDSSILPPASDYSGEVFKQLGVPPTLVADAPPAVRQLLAYGTQSGRSVSVQAAIKAIADTGVWGKPWADTYQPEDSDAPTLLLAPGDKVYTSGSSLVVVFNEFFPEASYSVRYGRISHVQSYHLTNIANGSMELAKSVPVKWDYDMAKSFVPQMDEKTYSNLMDSAKSSFDEAVENFPTGGGKGDSILAAKKIFDAPDFKDQYPTLKKLGIGALPSGTLAALHHANINGDPTVPQMLEVFAKYGHFNPKEKTDAEIWADSLNLDTEAPYFVALSKSNSGGMLFYSLNGADDPAAQYMALASALNGKKISTIAELEDVYDTTNFYDTAEKIWDQLQGELGKVKKPKSDNDELQLSKINKKLGGMHSKQVWVDQHGNEWMTKAFPSDPNGSYRVDVEHTANEIARLYGYNAPATRVMEIEGKHQYVQLLAPASGTLGNQSWSSMPDTLVTDAMVEHVIDWVVSNHDSHSGNILKTPDGMHAYGIDKGQAGRFFGKDKLAEGYSPNPEPAWYDNVYKAIRTKQMSKEQADVIRDAVLRKAAQVATRNEDRFTELMHASQGNRVSYPSAYPNAQAWVDAHNERRKAAFDDFAKLYKGLYEKAGYDWGDKETLDDYLPKKVDERFHVAPSDELVEDVKKYGTLGVPLFYKTGVFADDSILVYKTKDAKGGDTLRANATLLPDADNTFMSWLKNHTIEKVHATSLPEAVVENPNKHADLPHLGSAYPALVNYAKTVNTHASDGNYTASTVEGGLAAYESLKNLYTKVKDFSESYPTKLFSDSTATFYTHEQQDTWMAHANRMLQQFEIVSDAKSKGVKVSALTDDTPFQMPVYKPSEWLDTSGTPKVTHAYEHNGLVQQKWSDGNYTATDAQGNASKSTKGDFAYALKHGEFSESHITKDSPAEAEVEAESVESVVSVANVPVKVSYQPASSFARSSADGFEVTESGGTTKFTGYEYRIEVGDIVIQYQGLDDKSVARAQRGMARIEMRNWDGNPDALEKVNELFESIGLDISDATEQSLEIGYYRRLAATANRRKLSAKYKALVEKKVARTGDQAEVGAYRKILEDVYGKDTMQDFYGYKGWLPYAKEGAFGGVAGTVQWMRPDYSIEDLQKWWGGTTNLPTHQIKDGSATTGSIGKTGYFSTEHRMRVLGMWVNGQSSGSDQTEHGSSEYLYFRPANYGYGGGTHSLYLEPEYAISGSVYGADHDAWGSTKKKLVQSPFGLEEHIKHSTTEILPKNGLTLFDGIAAIYTTASVRKEILDHYEKLGITEIRGIPVAERIVTTSQQMDAVKKKVWDLAKQNEKNYKSKKGS